MTLRFFIKKYGRVFNRAEYKDFFWKFFWATIVFSLLYPCFSFLRPSVENREFFSRISAMPYWDLFLVGIFIFLAIVLGFGLQVLAIRISVKIAARRLRKIAEKQQTEVQNSSSAL
jgi:predicted membrane protein